MHLDCSFQVSLSKMDLDNSDTRSAFIRITCCIHRSYGMIGLLLTCFLLQLQRLESLILLSSKPRTMVRFFGCYGVENSVKLSLYFGGEGKLTLHVSQEANACKYFELVARISLPVPRILSVAGLGFTIHKYCK
jgi:hypothetical protein